MPISTSVIAIGVIVALETGACALYARAIVRGEVVPSRATWLIWTPLLWLTVGSSWQAGAELALVKTIASAAGVSVIAILALRHGTGGSTRSDGCCFGLTVLGVAGWAVLTDPLLGLLLFILADGVGAFPTLRDVWRDPSRERPGYWLIGATTSLLTLTLIADQPWTTHPDSVARWSYPVYVLMLNGAVLVLIVRSLRLRRPVPAVRVTTGP